MDLLKLYKYADNKGIDIYDFSMEELKSISTKNNCIGIDKTKLNKQEEKVCLAHEIGHCETGSFYNSQMQFDIRRKHEYKANRWAVHTLLPIDDFKLAMKKGNIEVWQLAECFGVTEEFVKLAHYVYTCEGLL